MNSGKAKKERREKREAYNEAWSMPPTIVVVGYPRSGTTTVMRMLFHGGIEIIAEDRTPELKKKLRKSFWPYGDAEVKNFDVWKQENPDPRSTSGKAIKIVSTYMNRIFLDRPLRVIFILRDFREVIASLLRARIMWPIPPDAATAMARKLLAELNIPTLYLQYKEMVEYPRTTAMRIADFLGVDLDIDKAITAVDKNPRKHLVKEEQELITFKFDYVRDFRGGQDDPVIPVSEEAKATEKEKEAA